MTGRQFFEEHRGRIASYTSESTETTTQWMIVGYCNFGIFNGCVVVQDIGEHAIGRMNTDEIHADGGVVICSVTHENNGVFAFMAQDAILCRLNLDNR